MRSTALLALLLPALLAAQAPGPARPLPRPEPEKPAPSKPFGNLRVHVENAKGAPVIGALVALPKLDRAFPTEETGDVLLIWIPEGTHVVKVSKTGFKGVTVEAKVERDVTSVLKVRLEIDAK